MNKKQEAIKQYLSKQGKRGGDKVLKKFGKKHFKKMAQLSLAKRQSIDV